jgi:hypothetical protein
VWATILAAVSVAEAIEGKRVGIGDSGGVRARTQEKLLTQTDCSPAAAAEGNASGTMSLTTRWTPAALIHATSPAISAGRSREA